MKDHQRRHVRSSEGPVGAAFRRVDNHDLPNHEQWAAPFIESVKRPGPLSRELRLGRPQAIASPSVR